MLKKVFTLGLFVLFGLLVACTKPDVTVTFDSQGGSAVEPIVVQQGNTIEEPEDPTKPDSQDGHAYSFTGWYLDAEATEPFSFDTPINSDLTLYAGWSTGLVVRFNTKTDQSVQSQILPLGGGDVVKPADPTRDGFRFGGWFYGRSGLTQFEPEAVTFPVNVTSPTAFYAYWEPVNSKDITWARGETYTSTIVKDTPIILNPTTYTWSHESDYIASLSTNMYSNLPDWDKAIDMGVADYIGDFSRIESGELNVAALDFINTPVGAVGFPVNSEGEDFTIDGKYDRDVAPVVTDTEWTITIRDDLKFEDGTPITADTFEFTLKQFLDPVQLNYRATLYYRNTTDNKSGYPIINAEEYFKGEAEWDSVGFEVLDDYTFKIKLWYPISQSSAIAFSNIRLLHPAIYTASLTEGTNSTYGTPANFFVSYGPYLIKDWDPNQRLVFNKNYNYVAKEMINYKSLAYEFVANIAERNQMFDEGIIDVFGVSNDYMAEFAEDPSLRFSWDGYPFYIIPNTAESSNTDAPSRHPIMADKRFRQALFYGFDRNEFNSNVYAPNVPNLLPIPIETKQYVNDSISFAESAQHAANLLEFGINTETNGYNQTKAKALFDEAYADWVTNHGGSGKVQIRYVTTSDSEVDEAINNFVKQTYESVFGTDKFELVVEIGSSTSVSAKMRTWDFDIAITSIGFGAADAAYYQYPAIGFLGALVGAGSLGLSQPYDDINGDEDGIADYANAMITVDMENTYDYLKGLPELSADFQNILDLLEADGDKPEGILEVSVYDSFLLVYYPNPWDAVADAPFPGADEDMHNFTAALEKVFLEYMPLVPLSSRRSASVFHERVEILWPAFHTVFGWGSNSYRFLNSDPDFADGMYNHFRTLWLESQE